jgi:hypothetical protein
MYLYYRARLPITYCMDRYAALQLLINAVYDNMLKERLLEGKDA